MLTLHVDKCGMEEHRGAASWKGSNTLAQPIKENVQPHVARELLQVE
jgi:hypothetical protein